jgi:hypothetical protein
VSDECIHRRDSESKSEGSRVDEERKREEVQGSAQQSRARNRLAANGGKKES